MKIRNNTFVGAGCSENVRGQAGIDRGGIVFFCPVGSAQKTVDGVIDKLQLSPPTAAHIQGWAIDGALGAGKYPATIVVRVDGVDVGTGIADEPRSDLVQHGVAPNAEHGFHISLEKSMAATLQTGEHKLEVLADGAPLKGSPYCMIDGAPAGGTGGCDNGQTPSGPPLIKGSGIMENNVFSTCKGVPSVNNNFPGCDSDWEDVGNLVNSMQVVDLPRIRMIPYDMVEGIASLPVTAEVLTPGTTLRFTTDGSRPEETSRVLPADGYHVPWPGPSIAFNVRAFHPQMRPSCTNGVVLEMNHEYRLPEEAALPVMMRGKLDGLDIASEQAKLEGWVVNGDLEDAGMAPVTVTVRVDGTVVTEVVADIARSSLQTGGAAPNSEHAFDIKLEGDTLKDLMTGAPQWVHTWLRLSSWPVGSPATAWMVGNCQEAHSLCVMESYARRVYT
jgi:hypothetical protein